MLEKLGEKLNGPWPLAPIFYWKETVFRTLGACLKVLLIQAACKSLDPSTFLGTPTVVHEGYPTWSHFLHGFQIRLQFENKSAAKLLPILANDFPITQTTVPYSSAALPALLRNRKYSKGTLELADFFLPALFSSAFEYLCDSEKAE